MNLKDIFHIWYARLNHDQYRMFTDLVPDGVAHVAYLQGREQVFHDLGSDRPIASFGTWEGDHGSITTSNRPQNAHPRGNP